MEIMESPSVESPALALAAGRRVNELAPKVPLPLFAGGEGHAAKRWEVRVCTADSARPSPPEPSARVPPLPRKAGEEISLRLEDRLDRQVEQFRDPEGEREAGVVAAGLDRVDALARDFEPFGQVALAPVALGPEHLEAVLHLASRPAQPPTPRPANQTIAAQYISTCGTWSNDCRKPQQVVTISMRPVATSDLRVSTDRRYSSPSSIRYRPMAMKMPTSGKAGSSAR